MAHATCRNRRLRLAQGPWAAALDAECDSDRLGLVVSLQVEFNEDWRNAEFGVALVQKCKDVASRAGFVLETGELS